MLRTAFSTIDAIGRPEEASAEERLRVSFLVWMGVLMAGGGFVWGLLCAAMGLYGQALIPLSYLVVTIGNLVYLHFGGRLRIARVVQIGISLLLPFLFQLSLGGFLASGGVVLWSMLSLVGALTFASPRHTVATIATFVVLVVLAGVFDPYVVAAAPAGRSTTWFFVVNVVFIGSITGSLVAYLDHERRQGAADVRVAMSTIRTLNLGLAAQAERAQTAEVRARAASEAKSEFLADMSHELRTPLSAIIGYAEILAEDLPEPHSRDAAQIRNAGTSLLALVTDIMDLSQSNTGGMQLIWALTDIDELVQSTVGALLPAAKARRTDLTVSGSLGSELYTDARRFKQILLNVVSDALTRSPGASVSVLTHLSGRHVEIRVIDTGPGMDADELALAMMPFQRPSRAKARRLSVTSLGLPLARQFAQALGGDLTLSSAEEGTTVLLRVPAFTTNPAESSSRSTDALVRPVRPSTAL